MKETSCVFVVFAPKWPLSLYNRVGKGVAVDLTNGLQLIHSKDFDTDGDSPIL